MIRLSGSKTAERITKPHQHTKTGTEPPTSAPCRFHGFKGSSSGEQGYDKLMSGDPDSREPWFGDNEKPVETWTLSPLVLMAVSILAASLAGSKSRTATTVGNKRSGSYRGQKKTCYLTVHTAAVFIVF